MARRKNNKKPGTNLYQRQVELPRGTDGKRKRRTIYAATVAGLNRKEHELKEQIRLGRVTDPTKMSVPQYCREWLKIKLEKNQIQESTFFGYELVIKHHIEPQFGSLNMGKVTHFHVHSMLASMKTGASKKRHAFTILNQACQQAVRMGLLSFNPCDSVDRPAPSRKELTCWSIEETQRFLKESKTCRYHALFVLALLHGARTGELLALEWSDIDFSEPSITISKTVKDSEGGLIVGVPKSSRSRRRIILSQHAVVALQEHREREQGKNRATKLVFCTKHGNMTKRSVLRARHFQGIIKRAGVPVIRMHDMRHSAATNLLASGENPKVVSDLLGHSSVAFTLDTYTHVLPSMQQSTASKVDGIYEL